MKNTSAPRKHRRWFLSHTAMLATGFAITPKLSGYAAANDEIRIGFLSCGGRANELMGSFAKVPGVKIVGLSDPDSTRVAKAKTRFPDAKTATDLRKLIEDPNIDAVVVATCNHWHCLASIWAMQAGKDVYVEKPLSHSQWEGEQTIAAARKYQRICQVGTQQRSDPMQTELKKFLHEEMALGQIQRVQVNRYGVRGPIGKRSEPLPKDPNIDWNLWLGPAADQPVFRNAWHYDWHWDWNTGSGEMGNWGVHVLDDVRNVVFRDSVQVPKRILGGGGRIVWNDAGQSPNVHAVAFDTGSIPVVIGLSNLPDKPDGKKSPDAPGPSSGYVVYCQAGRLEGQRGSAKAFDRDGKLIKEFKGNGGGGHQANFIQAVRNRKPEALNAEVQIGHDSTGWCNFANICFQAADHQDLREKVESAMDHPGWEPLMQQMLDHLNAHGVQPNDSALRMSHWMDLDPKTGRFVGQYAQQGNALIKRQYREGFEVPQVS
ncbi:MAG: Gfo/Idh/MocA family oxidoreductase [Planctomycetes bacterium]|nr:Gfo/Idh/MocA family oxidoreductase [Planctomycetota bacterium]